MTAEVDREAGAATAPIFSITVSAPVLFNQANVATSTFAACPALQRSIPARQQCNEAGLPI
jgi:hypothetical protein